MFQIDDEWFVLVQSSLAGRKTTRRTRTNLCFQTSRNLRVGKIQAKPLSVDKRSVVSPRKKVNHTYGTLDNPNVRYTAHRRNKNPIRLGNPPTLAIKPSPKKASAALHFYVTSVLANSLAAV